MLASSAALAAPGPQHPGPWRTGLAMLARRVRTNWEPHRLCLSGSWQRQGGLDAAIDAFAQWCAANEGAVCELALPSGWLMCHVHAEGLSHGQAREEAFARWAHYHDLPMDELAAQWLTRQLGGNGFGLLCAMPGSWLQALRVVAKRHRVVLAWVGPWWVHGVPAWLHSLRDADPASFPRRLTLIDGDERTHFQAVRAQAGEVVPSMVWVEAASVVSGENMDECIPGTNVFTLAPEPGDGLLWQHDGSAPIFKGDAALWLASPREAEA